jgi:hypothetical protein
MSAEVATDRYASDRYQIEDLAKRYAHGIDARNWAQVDSCFAVDAQVHGTQFSGPYPEYMGSLRGAVESFGTTMHFFGNQLTEFNDAGAHVTTYGIAYHLANVNPGSDFVIGVRYIDDVVRSDNGWIIQARVVQGIWRQPLGDDVQVLAPRS